MAQRLRGGPDKLAEERGHAAAGGPRGREAAAALKTARHALQHDRAKVLARIEQAAVMNEDIDDPSLAATLARQFEQVTVTAGLADDPRLTPLRDALASGDREQVLTALSNIADEAGITRIGGNPQDGFDQIVVFDPRLHQPIGSGVRSKGQKVRVVRPGYSVNADDGTQAALEKAAVEYVDPAELEQLARSRGADPQPSRATKPDLDLRKVDAASSDGPGAGLKEILRQRGDDGPPEVVSKKALDAHIASGATELHRGIVGAKGRTAGELAEQFRSGDLYVAKRGYHGAGIYVSSSAALAGDYGEGPGLLRMALRPDARVATKDQLDAARKEMTDRENLMLLDDGMLAAALGYDAIVPSDRELANGAANFILLNRRAVWVQKAA